MSVSATAQPTHRSGYSETFPSEAESAKTARRLVRTALTVWGLEHLAADGALVVTELVANAVTHTRGHSLRVMVTRIGDDLVRIGVVDKSLTPPMRRNAEDTDVHGRGLALVEALATRWGTDRKRWGKCVWAELKATNDR